MTGHRRWIFVAVTLAAIVAGLYAIYHKPPPPGRPTPRRPENLFPAAEASLNAKTWDDAIEKLDVILGLDPKYEEAFYARAMAYKGRYEERKEKADAYAAIADLTRVIELNPEYADAYMKRGELFSEKGFVENAIVDLTEFIRLTHRDSGRRDVRSLADAHYARGLAYAKRDNLRIATEELTETIRLAPEDVEAYRKRGQIFQRRNDIQSAIVDFREAIQRAPSHAEAWYELGIALKKTGDIKGARDALSKAIGSNLKLAADPSLAAAYEAQGELELAVGQQQDKPKDDAVWETAVTNAKQAIDLMPLPDDAKTFCGAGRGLQSARPGLSGRTQLLAGHCQVRGGHQTQSAFRRCLQQPRAGVLANGGQGPPRFGRRQDAERR